MWSRNGRVVGQSGAQPQHQPPLTTPADGDFLRVDDQVKRDKWARSRHYPASVARLKCLLELFRLYFPLTCEHAHPRLSNRPDNFASKHIHQSSSSRCLRNNRQFCIPTILHQPWDQGHVISTIDQIRTMHTTQRDGCRRWNAINYRVDCHCGQRGVFCFMRPCLAEPCRAPPCSPHRVDRLRRCP